MRTNYIKQLFIALFLLITSAGTASAVVWQLDKQFLTTPGRTDTIRLSIEDNTFIFSAFQLDIQLPEGLTMKGDASLGSLASSSHQLEMNQLADGTLRFVAYANDNQAMQSTTGSLLLIPVAVNEQFSGNSDILISKAILSNASSEKQEIKDQRLTVHMKQQLSIEVKNQKQFENQQIPYTVDFVTTPAGLEKFVTVTYFKDEACQTKATEEDLMKAGDYFVRFFFKGND